MFKYCNHLGYVNPYYIEKNGKFVIRRKISEILNESSNERIIDPIATIELFNKNYILANRTLIREIQRVPWMAKPNAEYSDWEYFKVPEHGYLDIPEDEIASNLFQKICCEIELYIGDKKNIGILLSGGMDSRIVAGTLDYLIKTKRLKGLNVVAFTWGNSNTRDVVYAKEIASRLNWKWKHFIVTEKDLLNNLTETAMHGCEYSPIHLHAIPQVRDQNNIDIILGGSYGDSIGRGEYSGTKIENLRPIEQNIRNIGNVFDQVIFVQQYKKIIDDIKHYHLLFPRPQEYMQNELDYQLHYWRRMLNPCMELLTERNAAFHQVFTHPDVFGYLWSIRPFRRNDKIYRFILDFFHTRLDDIPWARTGLKYGQLKGTPDNYLKKHHTYSKMIRYDLFEEIKDRALSDELSNLGLFNMSAIKTLFKLIKRVPPSGIFFLEKIIWLASLAEMSVIYDLKACDSFKKNNSLIDLKTIISISKDYLIPATKARFKDVVFKRMS